MSTQAFRKPTALDRAIGRRIVMARARTRLSQENVAADLGTHRQTILRYEKGTAKIAAARLWQIAKSTGCDVGFFFEEMPK